MESAPLILISPSTTGEGAEFGDRSISLSNAYGKAIEAAGGLPLVLPSGLEDSLAAESVRRCDGVVLTGGDDIQTNLYRRSISKRLKETVVSSDAERDFTELVLIQESFRQRKPLLAICRGHQLLNAAFGGDLLVDIAQQRPGALRHDRSDLKDSLAHDIEIAPGTLMARIFGSKTVAVNSCHHQAVMRVAKPFRASAWSGDGIVEALELSLADRDLLPYLLSVQFHPERLFERNSEFLEVFRSFIEACRSEFKHRL